MSRVDEPQKPNSFSVGRLTDRNCKWHEGAVEKPLFFLFTPFTTERHLCYNMRRWDKSQHKDNDKKEKTNDSADYT